MSCEWVCQHIDAYELGLLDEADCKRLEAHVAECAACRRLLDEMRAADEAVGEAIAWVATACSPGAARGRCRGRSRGLPGTALRRPPAGR